MKFKLDVASLSLAPTDGTGGLLWTGKDPLSCWPHEYDSAAENAHWARGSWPKHLGRTASTVADCSFEPYAMN